MAISKTFDIKTHKPDVAADWLKAIPLCCQVGSTSLNIVYDIVYLFALLRSTIDFSALYEEDNNGREY